MTEPEARLRQHLATLPRYRLEPSDQVSTILGVVYVEVVERPDHWGEWIKVEDLDRALDEGRR